jgi:hypothetical protein
VRTAIPAPPGYELLKVWRDNFSYDSVPVIAFIVDAELPYDLDVIACTGETLANDEAFTGLALPDGRVVATGSEFDNAESYVQACKRVKQ